MTRSIKLSNLRNGEYIQLMTDILDILTKNDPAALQVANLYSTLQIGVEKMENLFKESRGSGITDELFDLDARRDEAFNGIAMVINGYAYHHDAILKNHAMALQDHLSNFGTGIARENYQSQTAILRKILSDWETNPTLATALSALHLDNWKAELAAANNLFSERYLARVKESAFAPPGNIKALREEANEAWFALRDLLNAWFTLQNGAEPFGRVAGTINSVMENYREVMKGMGREGK